LNKYTGYLVTARFMFADDVLESKNIRRVIAPIERTTVIVLAESYIYENVIKTENLATKEKHGRGRNRLPCLVVARLPFKFSQRQRHVFRVPMPSRIDDHGELVYNNLVKTEQTEIWRFRK